MNTKKRTSYEIEDEVEDLSKRIHRVYRKDAIAEEDKIKTK